MRYTTLLLCFCSILLLGSCKSQPSAQNGQPLEVMTFNVRLDIPSDSVNNWNNRKGDACRMIAYYSPDLLGMQYISTPIWTTTERQPAKRACNSFSTKSRR